MVHILDLVLESTMMFFFSLAMLAECVSSFFRLTTLLLPECLLRDLCFLFCHESSAWHLFQVLADALRVNTTIKELSLNGNPQIGDEGVKAWWLQWVERLGVWWCESGWIPAMWSVSRKLCESGFGLSVTFHQGQSWEVCDRIWSEVLKLLNPEPFQD